MKCPNKICQKEIPDDSIFCDQCGIHLRQCTKCGSIMLSKFCTSCGGIVMDRKFTQNAETKITAQESCATKIIETPSALEIVHSDFTLNISPSDILGRTQGAHSSFLMRFPVISSRHAKLDFLDDKWFITDLHSSNKSFLNGKVLPPDVPTELHNNDTLVLANVPFTVIIK